MEIKVLQSTYDKPYHAYRVGNEPLVFHCHHYNLFLQNTIEDAKDFIDVQTLLTQSAEHVVYHQWKAISSSYNLSLEDLLSTFSTFGFGKLSAVSLDEKGGIISSPYDHYGLGYISKYEPRTQEQPAVSYFTQGFIAALFAYYFQKPLYSYQVIQTKCFSKGAKQALYEVKLLSEPQQPIFDYQHGQGVLGKVPLYENRKDTSIDYLGIREALISMPLEGNPETGLIDAFGVLLTRHYANYYCNISFGLLKGLVDALGEEDGYDMAKDLLIEAGHVCGFNTMGGIMLSMEWNALIKPMIQTREDWMHGIIACINALGWGTYIIEELIPYQSMKVRIYNDYESNFCLQLPHKPIRKPISFMATGVMAALMNLLYHSDITQNPTLDEEFYNKTFKTQGKFVGKQTMCRSMGAEYGLIEVTKES